MIFYASIFFPRWNINYYDYSFKLTLIFVECLLPQLKAKLLAQSNFN